jgi:hypothetical protein
MDTDNLSNETYEAIITEAENFDHDLTLQFGILSNGCKDEYEYIEKATKLIRKIKKMDEKQLEDIFSGSSPDLDELHETLDQMLDNIENVNKIPFSKRHFEY